MLNKHLISMKHTNDMADKETGKRKLKISKSDVDL